MTKVFENLYRRDQRCVRRWVDHYTDEVFYVLNKKLQKEVTQLLTTTKVVSGRGFFIAAMIFHHGFTQASARKAVRYAEKAVENGYGKGTWLVASATDRLLQLQGKPQKFGTQIVEEKNGAIRMYPVDSRTTDEERHEYGLPTLAELKERL